MNNPLTPDPSISDGLAHAFGAMHASTIALAIQTLTTPDNLPLRDQIIKRHTEALIQLGRPRVADDLLPNGWFINDQGEWERPCTDDDWPFPVEDVYSHTSGNRVFAENNHHARTIDGILPPSWISYYPEHYVV